MHDNMISESIWLIGAGSMAVDYSKVLEGLSRKYSVIGRGIDSSESFTKITGHPVLLGGVSKAIEVGLKAPEYAIIAVDINQLATTCISLIDFGVKNILIEKPAGLNSNQIRDLSEKVRQSKSNVYVAYNRRMYASTLKALEIINEDGGVKSFNFEFTEWGHVIEKLDRSSDIMQEWFLANSSHVVDLAFYLGGFPKSMTCYTSGTTKWYKKASIFTGAGVASNCALFSYQANWNAPGRWSVEIVTQKHRLIFRPLEKLQIQRIGSVQIDLVEIEDDYDTKYKPGLFLQTKSFLDDDLNQLLTIAEHSKRMIVYDAIENGKNYDENCSCS